MRWIEMKQNKNIIPLFEYFNGVKQKFQLTV